ncbi:hypothetical protein AB0D34_22570 [Streptomyces sp. NPDC048420]|uniref:hypothetical protein n=1 Tax=Streptomyces sp. NPDC048420 TaxID=3155755 RepID=UPI00343BB210
MHGTDSGHEVITGKLLVDFRDHLLATQAVLPDGLRLISSRDTGRRPSSGLGAVGCGSGADRPGPTGGVGE